MTNEQHDVDLVPTLESIFGEVISTYGDAEAVRDGYLVKWDDVRINRVTRNLFDRYTNKMGLGAMIDITPLRRLLDEVLAQAKPGSDGRVFATVADGTTVWLIPNEVGALTAMLPEDY